MVNRKILSLEHDGVVYTLAVGDSDDGEDRKVILLHTTRPPLGLDEELYRFEGKLPTIEQVRDASRAQRKGSRTDLSKHDLRRRR